MRVEVVAVALLVALSVGVLLPNHPAGRDPAEDAGVFFYAAQRLLDGGAPYRDIWDHKPPGVYFVDAVGIALAGRTGVWFVQVAFLVAAVLLGYRALRREFGATAAFVGSFAWLAALPRLFLEYGQTSFVEFYALPLQFGALVLFTAPLTRGRALGNGGDRRGRTDSAGNRRGGQSGDVEDGRSRCSPSATKLERHQIAESAGPPTGCGSARSWWTIAFAPGSNASP